MLLTGFEPFAGDPANPSGEAVHRVAAHWNGPEVLVTAVLPVTFAGSAARMRELMDAHEPDVVIATGLAGGRAAIGVERVAVNLDDARIPDNDGEQPVDLPVVEGAPAAAFSTLPIKAIARAINEAGIPAEVSYSAGTFVCNHVFFSALHAAPAQARAGFLHVPWSAEHSPDPSAPSLPLHDIVRALEIAVRTACDTEGDLPLSAGTLS